MIKMLALVKCLFVVFAAAAAHGFSMGDTDVVFHLFTRQNPELSQPLLPMPASIMTSSYLSLIRRTVITIHTEGDNAAGNFNAFMNTAYLAAQDVNLIAVDWSAGSGMYTEALGNAPQCGRVIAQFINILIEQFGYDANLVHIVGVGLGGHIAGIAARNIVAEIPHIVAIDPSFHGWTHHPERLHPDDALVVEVLHTTAGIYGYDYPLGDIDFYPNGGTHQTGCGADTSCSHSYGYIFYAESILREINGGEQFVGTACDSYEEAVAQQCNGNRNVNFGGPETKSGVSGIFWFRTNMVPPFATG